MTKDWEATFGFWAQSPSDTEAARCENVIRAIGDAVSNSPKLSGRKIKVFR